MNSLAEGLYAWTTSEGIELPRTSPAKKSHSKELQVVFQLGSP